MTVFSHYKNSNQVVTEKLTQHISILWILINMIINKMVPTNGTINTLMIVD